LGQCGMWPMWHLYPVGVKQLQLLVLLLVLLRVA
jgi:hypothetical protein